MPNVALNNKEVEMIKTNYYLISDKMGAVSGDEVKIHAFNFDIITQTLDLLKDGGFNDVTIICRNGKFTSNSVLLAAMSKVIRNTFQDMQFGDEDLMISIPDIDSTELEQFFEAFFNRNESIIISESLNNLLNNNKCHSQNQNNGNDRDLVPNVLMNKIVDDKQEEGALKDGNIKEEYDNIDDLIVMIDPLDVDEECDREVDVKNEYFKEEYRADIEDNNTYQGRFQCHGECERESCRKIFKYNSDLERHIQAGKKRIKRINQKQFDKQCRGRCGNEFCMKVFPFKGKLLRHIKDKKYAPQKCHICGKIPKYRTKEGMIKHLEEHEGGWEGKSRCKICLKSFPTEDFEQHKSECEAEEEKKMLERERLKEVGFQCHGKCGKESCRKVFAKKCSLKRHIEKASYVPQTCPICGIIPKFQNAKDGITKHLEEHEGGWEGKSRCKICLKSIPTEEIEQHQSGCNPSVVCSICGKLMKSQSSLASHITNIHGEFRVEDIETCHICGKKLKNATRLKTHLQSHREKIPCPQCGILVRDLQSHIAAVHTSDQDKRFQCQDCGKGFNGKKKLEDHRMNVHLKLQPYKCRYGCDFGYNDISNRNQHEKKKHGKLFMKKSKDEKFQSALRLHESEMSAAI